MSSAPTYLKVADYKNETELAVGLAVQEKHGRRYNLSGVGQKQLILVAKDTPLRALTNKASGDMFLSLDPEQNEGLVSVLEQMRVRLTKEMGLDANALPPIITPGTAAPRKKPASLILNLAHKVTLKDVSGAKIDFETLEGKDCRVGVFIHIQSVFQSNKSNKYTFKFNVNHMVLMSSTEIEAFEKVEPIDISEPTEADLGDLL
jgi:hypothetical protein